MRLGEEQQAQFGDCCIMSGCLSTSGGKNMQFVLVFTQQLVCNNLFITLLGLFAKVYFCCIENSMEKLNIPHMYCIFQSNMFSCSSDSP